MEKIVHKITKRRKDKVRIYTLCVSCQDAVRNIGTGQMQKKGEVIAVQLNKKKMIVTLDGVFETKYLKDALMRH